MCWFECSCITRATYNLMLIGQLKKDSEVFIDNYHGISIRISVMSIIFSVLQYLQMCAVIREWSVANQIITI